MTHAATVLAHAVAAGLVDASAVLAGRVTVHAIGASNSVHRVELNAAPLAFVKGTGQAAEMDGDDSVARESEVLRLLRGLCPSPGVLPAGGSDELWLTPVPGTSLAELTVTGDVETLSDAFASLGRALAELHRIPPPPNAPAFRLPWPLLDELPGHMETARFHEVPTRVIETARSLTDITSAVSESWAADSWTHGDVSAMNAILGPDATVRLIDWEGAGIGDPSWDLAGANAMARFVAPTWFPVAWARLLASYREAGGPARPPDTAMLCVRMLVAAYQQAVGAFAVGSVPDADGAVTQLLAEVDALTAQFRSEADHVLP